MTRMKGWPIVFRTVIMSGISIVFLWARCAKISRLRGLGLPIGNWRYVEPVIWIGALLAWLVTGWRDWKLGRAEVEGNR